MSTIVLYAAGLQGGNQIMGNYPAPIHKPYAATVREAAETADAVFKQVHYQTSEKPFPTVYQIGQTMCEAILDEQEEHDALILVGSGAGGGAWLEGYAEHLSFFKGKPVSSLLLINAVHDMGAAIEYRGTLPPFQAAWKASIEDGEDFPVYVTRAEGQPDPGGYCYPAKGLDKDWQYRLLSNANIVGSVAQDALRRMKTSGTTFKCIAADVDQMSPVSANCDFLASIGQPDNLYLVKGVHNQGTDERHKMIASLVKQAVIQANTPKHPKTSAKPAALYVPKA